MKGYPGKQIASLHRKSQSFWTKKLKEYDITSAEYPILFFLNQKEGITQDEIAMELAIDKSAITRGVKSLMEKGFIERKKDETDLRCNRIYLTDKGHSSKALIVEGTKEWNQIILKNMNPDDLQEVTRILSQMSDNIEDYLNNSKEFN